MSRPLRRTAGGIVHHCLNRGDGRRRLFHKPGDYDAFAAILAEGLERSAIELFAYWLMPNHWHLALRPAGDGDLAAFMRWVGVTHVRRHHAHYHTRAGGHLYQGRYKSFPVRDDRHLLTVLRYVEATRSGRSWSPEPRTDDGVRCRRGCWRSGPWSCRSGRCARRRTGRPW